MDPFENDCCASLRAELAAAGVYPASGDSPTGLWTLGSAVTTAAAYTLGATNPELYLLSTVLTFLAEFTPPSSPQAPTQWADLEGGESFRALSFAYNAALNDPETQDLLSDASDTTWTNIHDLEYYLGNLAVHDFDYRNISVEDIAGLRNLLEIYDLPEYRSLTSVVEEVKKQTPALLTLYEIYSQNPSLGDLIIRTLPILEGYKEQLALLTLASVPDELDAILPLLLKLTPDQLASLAQNRALIVDLAEGKLALEDMTTAKDALNQSVIELYNMVTPSPQLAGELGGSRVLYPFISELLASESVQAVIAEQMFTAPALEGESTVFDEALESSVRRAMGMDEVAEKPEGMPDFLWGMGQGFFDRSLTEKPEDMSDEEWASLTGAWDVGQKAFGVEENPLEQMQTDVEDLKTTVPGMESDIAQAKTMAQDALAVKGTANSALTLASQALSVAEIARGIAERAQAAAAAAGGTRPGADSPDVDRPPGAGGYR